MSITVNDYVFIYDAVDALFAVYEASSLELWYFMENAAIQGAPRSIVSTIMFYTFLVFFLVFYLQVSLHT